MVWITVGGQLFTSVDGGKKWVQVKSGGINGDGKLWGITSDPRLSRTFYVSGESGLWKTTDGVDFTLMRGSSTGGAIIDPTNTSQLYVVGNGLFRYANGIWRRLSSDRTIKSVAVDPTNSNRIVYVTGDNPYHDVSHATGVWLSEDGGSTWHQQNTGLAILRSSFVTFNPGIPGQLILGSNGRGFWLGTLACKRK